MEQGLYLEAKNLLDNFLKQKGPHHQALFKQLVMVAAEKAIG